MSEIKQTWLFRVPTGIWFILQAENKKGVCWVHSVANSVTRNCSCNCNLKIKIETCRYAVKEKGSSFPQGSLPFPASGHSLEDQTSLYLYINSARVAINKEYSLPFSPFKSFPFLFFFLFCFCFIVTEFCCNTKTDVYGSG